MKVSESVATVLAASKVDGNMLVLPGQMDRKEYEKVAKVIEGMGGKWNRKAKGHIFDGDPREAIKAAIGGEVESWRDQGWFPTPLHAGMRVAALAGVRPSMSVLEPSAGEGALVRTVIDAVRNQGPIAITAVELDHGRAGKLALAMPGGSVIEGDFLRMAIKDIGTFDRIVMNPPFGKGADLKHVAHALQFLAPGGRLVAIVGRGALDKKTKLARSLQSRFSHVEDLPDGTFEDAGTSVRASIIVIEPQIRCPGLVMPTGDVA